MRGDRFLEETGGETCWCDEPVYFKEYNPAAEQVSWQLGFVKKKNWRGIVNVKNVSYLCSRKKKERIWNVPIVSIVAF